ncbi:hypothetical protein GCM10022226_65480 [Sphaerisporangium flaviroseum]|uniref:CBS domain-containing protein n=1 Tax=Sphaerisporangium flaviroseum TaxID=509199 RepID=A0ABP7J699_9ACTN
MQQGRAARHDLGESVDDATEILRTMASHKIRRLPVIDGHKLVGMVALADVARSLPDAPVGDLLDALTAD